LASSLTHAAFLIAFCACVIGACVWAYRRSRLLGIIIATGLTIRLLLGGGLFAVSYFHWPILTHVQGGDGFWGLAPDARVYFALARNSADHAAPVSYGSPSPTYVAALAFWLRASGTTVLWAVLFNLACYLATVVAIVAAAKKPVGRWLTAAVCCVTFSPALVLTGTQVLKDNFFVLLIVLGAISVLMLLRYSRISLAERPYALVGGIALAAIIIAAIGGIRAYYAVFLWLSLAVGLAVSSWRSRSGRLSFVVFGATVLLVLWGAFIEGSGAYYQYYGQLITKVTGLHIPIISGRSAAQDGSSTGGADFGELGSTLESLREGFVGSGGGTNLFRTRRGTMHRGVHEVAVDLGIGLAAVYVPISILRATSLVSFSGGKGFLTVTDVDTVFLDTSFVVVLVMMWRWRTLVAPNMPAAVCFLVWTLLSALAIAYIVTNFGTLFRLRLMIAAPTWMALLTICDDPFSAVRRGDESRLG
jgi:hypothetical protein